MNLRSRVVLTLLAALFALALPAVASAAVYEVNTTADEADKAVGAPCETNAGAGVCSLRAAMEVANSTTGVPDEIEFAANPFSGEDTDIIGLLSPLPTIVDQLNIRGGVCDTDAGVKGPCASAIRAGGALLVVEDDDVEIQGLGLLGAGTAINVTNASERFVAKGNWIGFNLAGVPGVGAVNNIGIYLDPGSDEATIGGLTAADRNVIGGNSVVGLDLEGASDATIVGNYFGVTPDGEAEASNPKDIEITDTVAFEATGNEVGTTVASGSAPCDGGCNVISGASTGIDLQGNGIAQNEEPATGPTTVHGNYIGLNAAGTATVANGVGVNVGEARDVLVGGPENQDANHIAGGTEGIFASNAEGFEAIGNVIGSGAPGAEISAPGKGVWVLNTSNANPVDVSGNVFDMDGGVGIQIHFGGTEVTDNFIEGAELGIWTKVAPNAAGGNLIEGNVIGESLASGVRIEDKRNEVLGNAVYKSGGPGILLEIPVALLFPTENLIGGNTTTDENNINESGGPAIKIVDESGNTEEDSINEIGRNTGAKNTGLFIDLVGAANAGILPPTFATSEQVSASGSAEPGATLRLFRKKAPEAGELESFLGETVADGAGNWKVTYAEEIPGGTLVAATQTSVEGATSELKVATTVGDPGGGGGGDGGGGSGGNGCNDALPAAMCVQLPPPPAPDTTPPTVRVTKAPKAKSTSTTAKFKFKSDEAGSRFECKLDKGKFRKCRSPKTYRKLKPGKHAFKVRATDKAGNVGKAVKRKFTVLS